jgi:ribonuclease H / adenosylcobalamin/alpha-ribazole phosphatase
MNADIPLQTIVYLVRHGDAQVPLDAEGHWLLYGPDAHLTETGRAKAALFGDLLRKTEPIHRVYSSTFPRARETAEIIASKVGIDALDYNERIIDTYAPALWGTRVDDIAKMGRFGFWDRPTKDQETAEQIEKRMLPAVDEIIQANPGKTLMIVSHGDPLVILTYRLHQRDGALPRMIEMEQYALGNVEAFRLVLDGQSRIVAEDVFRHQDGKIVRKPLS